MTDANNPYLIKNNQQLRKEIISNTSIHTISPKIQSVKSPPLASKDPKYNISQEDFLSSTERNMKFNIEQLQAKLMELFGEVRSSREQCRELNNQTAFLKKNLIYDHLYQTKTQLDGRIMGFFNQVRYTKNESEVRYDQIRKECGSIWEQTEKLREEVFQLQMRVEKIELRLGFQGDLNSQ